jgi:hypothetical protein
MDRFRKRAVQPWQREPRFMPRSRHPGWIDLSAPSRNALPVKDGAVWLQAENSTHLDMVLPSAGQRVQ